MKFKFSRVLSLLFAVLMITQSFFGGIIGLSAADGEGEDGSEEIVLPDDVSKLLMADRFVFKLPDADKENLLNEPVSFSGNFEDLTNQTRMQVLYNEKGRIDADSTAYLTYKLKNDSSQVLSLGTMVYFQTTGNNLCAYVLVPMVYDAATGERLDLVTSYEYKSGKYVLTDVMPTVEIPAGKEVFVAIPFVSVPDPTNYVPGLEMSSETYIKGFEPSKGVLWSNNAERTALMKDKWAMDGTTDCLQMQLFLGGNGANSAGARTYVGEFDFTITQLNAISKSEYYAYAYDPDNWGNEDAPTVGADPNPELLMNDKFSVNLPGLEKKNLLSADLNYKGVFSSLSNADKMQIIYDGKGDMNTLDTACVAYRLRNDSLETLSIGTMVYFTTGRYNLCALSLLPAVYDAESGARIDCKLSYEYNGGKYVLSDAMPTVEIPSGAEVYIVVPFTSVNDATQYVAGVAMEDDTPYVKGSKPQKGSLYSNNAERTALLAQKIAADGYADCVQVQIYLGGNGADPNGNRNYGGNFDFAVTELCAISQKDYFANYTAPEQSEKPPVGTDPDGEKYTTVSLTDSGLALAPSFDVNGNMLNVAYTRSEFASVARAFKNDGFNRVYVVTTRGGIPAASSASNQWNDPGDTRYTIADSLIVCGNTNFEFLYACKKEGLEVIAVYKPYEGGGVSKSPEADMSNSLYYEDTVGGYWTGYDAFLSAHPEMRLERKENSEEDARKNDTVTKIEAAFIIDAFSFYDWRGGKRQVAKVTSPNISEIKLYVSKNNTDYVEYEGEYTLSFTKEKRTYLDENGWNLFDKDTNCLVATIEGIEIGSEYQYMALTMADKTGRYIIPQSMIRIYNAKGEEIPSTVGTSVRYQKNTYVRPEGYIWGAEDIIRGTEPESLSYFASWGFEFDLDGNGSNSDSAYINSHVFGIARGHFEYAKGTYCEAYDEVRAHWLYEIQNLLLLGYDGIEIRLQAHSSMISDYAYYGFNEPMMEAFIEKYGYDPREEEKVSKETAYYIACLRGEYYMDFMREAESLVHSQGKVFGFHMRSAMIDTSMDAIMNTALHQCFCWAMPKIVINWREAVDLVDTITIKQNWSNNYNSEMIKELTDYAVSKNVKVWITAYTQQYTNVDEYGVQIGEANVDFFNQVALDPNVYGIQIYEWDPKGGRFQHAFGILKKELNYIPRRLTDEEN